ncbi:hypothetical protein Bca4012_098237 [Brassica carinata]|uniref:BnaC06g05670D protein n=1 Tax=Brassica napus TaxID=3708 RepID=A0A078GLN9_BRANA|nr:BnaC06g05670D [Brassica napus]
MHGNKIPPQLVTQVGDAFKRILQEVKALHFCLSFCGVDKKLKAELGGTDLDFHIRVTPHNFSPDHCTFTVSAASDSFNTEVLQSILN